MVIAYLGARLVVVVAVNRRVFATIACIWGYSEPLRFLCLREFRSIPESFYAELKKVIESYDWTILYDNKRKHQRCKRYGIRN